MRRCIAVKNEAVLHLVGELIFPMVGKTKRNISKHWKQALLIFHCLEILVLCGCGKADVSVFDGGNAFIEADQLVAIRPRDAGTAGARRAAVHLEKRLKAFGVTARIDTFSEENPDGKVFFNNVLGRLPGNTKRLIVLGSHFDTKAGISPDFQGANDSGSSSGVLLELARVLAEKGPLETEFLIAFFDGEECAHQYAENDGLHGSRRLAQQLSDAGGARHVEAVIILDMVGDKDLTVTVPRNASKRLVKELFFAAHEVGTRPSFSLGKGSILDDHVPFLLAGMPAVDLIDFEFGSEPGLNDYWHTLEDSMDKLSAESMQTIGDVVLRMIDNLQ